MSGKRKYTVPVLLIIITMLTFLIIVLLSRVLLDSQSLKTERGERLAAGYQYCITYAEALKQTAAGLLDAQNDAERSAAKLAQGKLELAATECKDLLREAGVRNGQSEEEASKAAEAPLQAIAETLAPIGASAGALTEAERATLTAAAVSADELSGILGGYSTPTGGDRFRQMQAGVDWLSVAQRFIAALGQAAANIG